MNEKDNVERLVIGNDRADRNYGAGHQALYQNQHYVSLPLGFLSIRMFCFLALFCGRMAIFRIYDLRLR